MKFQFLTLLVWLVQRMDASRFTCFSNGLAFAALVCGSGSPLLAQQNFGNLVLVGDSITQGGPGSASSYKGPGYRYQLWRHLADNSGHTYTFVGSQTGAYSGGGTPESISTYKTQAYNNVHEGHWGWRASWINGSVASPANRYNTNNLGQGTIANWTNQTGMPTTFATANAGNVTYTGSTYAPDTVGIMIGINDLSDGVSAATVQSRIQLMVQQYQTANPNAKIHVFSTLPVSTKHGSSGATNPKVTDLNNLLAANVAGWSTGTSTVAYHDIRTDFDADKMTYDNIHPNYVGEKIIARNMASALGIGARDNSVGLTTRNSSDFTDETDEFNSLPGPTVGTLIYRAGGTPGNITDPTPNDSLISLNSPTDQSSYLQKMWNIASNSSYTIEFSLKMESNTLSNNNVVLWSDDGTGGADAGVLRVFTNKVEWGFSPTNRYLLDLSDNTDAQHAFRVAFNGSTYSVWRDGVLIGDSLPGDASTVAANHLVLGDFSSNRTLDISSRAILDYVRVQNEAFAAFPEP